MIKHLISEHKSWNRSGRQAMLVDILLCTLISMALAVIVFAGFDSSEPLLANMGAMAGITLLVTGVLEAGYCSGKRADSGSHREKPNSEARFRYERGKLIAVLLSIAAMALSSFGLYQKSSGGSLGMWADFLGAMDKNGNLFPAVTVMVALLVFWLARIRMGICLLFLGGTFLAAFFDLLGYPVSASGLLLFLLGCLTLCFYRAREALGTSDFHWNALARSVMAAGLILLIAAGLFYGASGFLQPPGGKGELTARLREEPVMERLGIASTKTILTEEPIPPEIKKQEKPEEEKRLEEEKQQDQRKETGRIGKGLHLAAALAVTFQSAEKFLWIAVPIVIVLAAAAVPARILLRKRWYQKVLMASREQGVTLLYPYFLKRLGRIGLKRPQDMTLSEFAENAREALKGFAVYDADFLRLTRIYQKVIYGGQQVSEKEFELFQDFYSEFLKNLKKEMGSMKYLFVYFML
ncbi:DUF4129 domain-containing protein [Anoxybacterium hadale]|uniref:DUF4129 domain-containing protein n=1 Tax=Anoxybacterium hadale TaxID=3408580 RepID=UPI003B0060E2